MGWDTKVTGLPVGGYVINQESSKLNKPVLEAMKFDNSKYPTTPGEVGNEEFVFTPKEVDMYGIDRMDELNNSAKEAAHSSIDGLMAMNTLSQIPSMAGGGNIENPMLPSYENGGKVPGYQDGGSIYDELNNIFNSFDEEKIREEVPKKYGESIDPNYYFGSANSIDSDVDIAKALIDKLGIQKAFGGKFSQALSIPASEVGDGEGLRYYLGNAQYRGSLPDASLQSGAIRDALIKMQSTPQDSIPKALLGYQEGGSVSDATATSAMDELLAQAMLAESAQGQSQYSMVDADRVDAEENEMMDMLMSMVIPGAGVAGTTRGVLKQLGKRALKDVSKKEVVKTPVKHLSKIAGLKPFKQKEKVLDKIASTMKVAPGRKVKQTPRDLYDWKGYKVLENTLHKPFNKMDLINPGYLQRHINKLVKIKKPSQLKKITSGIKTSDVKRHDVVDALYKKGFLNVNDLKRLSLSYKKKGRREAIENLLKEESSSLFPGAVKGYDNGGKIDFSKPFMMSRMDDDISFEEDSLDKEIENKAKSKGSLKALLQKELLQSMITGENRPERIERSPMEDAYTSDPNPGFGITTLDDLIRRALEQHRFGEIPHKR